MPRLLPPRSVFGPALTALGVLLAWSGPATAQFGSSGPSVYRRGVLGQDLEIEFTGPALGAGVWLLSASVGPTLLPCSAPGFPVELEPNLSGAFVFEGLVFDAMGQFRFASGLPSASALAGFDLFAQAISLSPAGPCPIAGISTPLRFSLLSPSESVISIGQMVTPRREHGFDERGDGCALISGGENPDPANPFPLASLELYDPLREEFQLLGVSLPEPRTRHTTVRLTDGSVLITGGVGAGGLVLNSAVLFNRDGEVQPLPPMASARVHHQATLLDDGRVLVTGGVAGDPSGRYDLTTDFGYPLAFPTQLQTADTLSQVAAELFDPVSMSWQPVAADLQPRLGHGATRLTNGNVLITGGLLFVPELATLVETPLVTVWDPSSDTIDSLVVPELARAFHDQISTAEGGAIVAGGGTVTYDATRFALSSADNQPTALFPPPALGSSTISAPSFGAPPDGTSRVSLVCVPPGSPNPRYFVIACPEPQEVPPIPLGPGSRTIYQFDPTNVTWTPVTQMANERPGHRSLYLSTVERGVTTGSAWPTPAGTTGFDRTAEIFSFPQNSP